jgi:hypothetical protein
VAAVVVVVVVVSCEMEFDLRPLFFCISNWVKCLLFFLGVFVCVCVNEAAMKRRVIRKI